MSSLVTVVCRVDCVPDQDHGGAEGGKELVGDPEHVGQVQPRREADTLELHQDRKMSRSLEELDLCPLLAGSAFYLGRQED